MKTTRSLLCATGLLLSAALPASAVIYDATADFNTTANSSPWIYAVGNGDILETNYGDITTAWGWAQSGWTGGGLSYESWGIASASVNLAQINPGDLLTHGNTSILLTIQTTGLYQVDLYSWLGRNNGTTILGSLAINGNIEAQGFYTFASNSRSDRFQVFSGELALTAGDVLRFQTQGNPFPPASASDFVGVDFTVAAIPEPTTTALIFAFAGIVLILRRRRATC